MSSSRPGRPRAGGDTPWQEGMTVLGEFVIERSLGRGGFGEVVLAVSRRTGERYAVKRVRRDDPVEQGRFLTEAQRWTGLAPHPHITPCRFTRTVGNQMAVFSEHVGGGSLADWIKDGRLYARDPQETLATVLRIAVEAAWGLDAAHAHGLLHLDIKPGNVLLTERATARITDFGLAAVPERGTREVLAREFVVELLSRPGPGIDAATSDMLKSTIRQVMGEPRAGEPASALRAVADGVTPGYASPEQAEGRTLGRAADLWSWAVTVLEMFTGGRTWRSGTVAGASLEMYLNGESDTSMSLAMPEGVAELLRACFRPDPDERPRSLRAAADSLTRTAARECGITLDGEPPRSRPRSPAKGGYERRLPGGSSWQDPRELLGAAYRAAGRDPGDAVRFWPSGLGSRVSQAMEDLRALTEAARVLDTVDAPDPPYLGPLVTAESGRVRHGLGDLPGAVQAYRTSARALEALDSADARSLRLSVLHSLAIVVRLSGSPAESAAICDLVVDSAAGLEDPSETARFRGMALGTKANAVDDPDERLRLIERSLAQLRAAGEDEGLAVVLANQVGALAEAGRHADAAALWEQADEMIEAAASPGRTDLDAVRATLRLNRAVIATNPRDKAAYAQAAVDLYETLVHERGRHDVAGDLGRALFLTGQGHEHADRPKEALAAYRSARTLLEETVLRDGRPEYARDLAKAHDHESTLTWGLEDPGSALALARRAVEVWERVSDTDGERSCVVERADARRKLAVNLVEAGEAADASREFDEARRILGSAAEADADGRLAEALIHQGRAVLLRRTGDPDAACREVRTALDLLGGASRPEDEKARVVCLQTLNAVLANLGDDEEALVVADTIANAVESLRERGEGSRRDLADARQRRANVLIRLGHTTEALVPASQALDAYQHLIDEGRTDLVSEAARMRAALALALHRAGDIDGATQALETARRQFAGHSPYRWHGVLSPDAAKIPAALGTDAHSLMLEGLDVRLAGLAEIRTVKRRHLGRLLAALARRRDELMGGSMPFMEPAQVSHALEEMCGGLLWLAGKYPQDAVHEACAQTGLLLGISSMSCGRVGAARRGLRSAIDHGRVLVLERGRTGHLTAWANAHLALASWLTVRGDDEGADRTVREMQEHLAALAPGRVADWSAQARQVLASAGRRHMG
ncbi:protein kinase domain-containing protein [Streptomyces sp. NBC_01012]|uniref:serine/threonine-protein kinase n=1 Tax=Streptomyces sp. NBC_01012 TaxID=2903717 RepID=UPI00386BD2AA|nr:serine/threonine protein kinase [Streptomyces sp. NBC_01012]